MADEKLIGTSNNNPGNIPESVQLSAPSYPASKIVNVFISYASNDRVIAETLEEELSKVNKDRVKCFLDTKSIASGLDFEGEITKALGNADWLVCVYTGEQSEFCGYEIGVFRQIIRFPREQIDVSCFRQFCRAF